MRLFNRMQVYAFKEKGDIFILPTISIFFQDKYVVEVFFFFLRYRVRLQYRLKRKL